MTMPSSSVWNRHCWAWVVFSGWASISCKDDLNEIVFSLKLKLRLHLFSTFAEIVFWPVFGDKKLILYLKSDPNFHTRSITGCVLGDAGSESASTIKTRMKFITFRLAGWLVRLSSWVPISAGGGLSDFGVSSENYSIIHKTHVIT
jgi:hypothetical protein